MVTTRLASQAQNHFGNNITPATAQKTRKANSRIAAKQGRFRILVGGTSVPAGNGSNPAASVTDVRKGSYPTRMAESFTRYGVPASWQSFFGNANQAGNLPTFDPRISLGAGWSYDGTRMTLGGYLLNSVNTNPLTLTPTQAVRTFEIYSLFAPGAGTQTVAIGGSAPASGVPSIAQNATLAVNKSVASAAAASTSALTLTNTSTTITRTLGVIAVDDTSYGIDIVNAAIPGSLISDWAANNGVFSPINMFSQVGADLFVLDVLTNTRNAGSDLTAGMTDLQTQVTAAKAAGLDVLLVLSPPSSSADIDAATQIAYNNAARALAIQTGCMFADLFSRWIDWATGNTNGFFYDDKHLSNYGHADAGDYLAKLIMSI
ncbi:SGNH/GDSL hydrolase family protein [Bradyrhizobium cosmicum]|uniref:Phosphoenolpyruvate carboxykinase n=1 Tax=Bradyrhizobium cosmicum TaxID=1404864 RepID=A0AAI8QB69_9BRAD|nr:SGNH/GDSL hydrolase family protein [Bradyrhizobium cosmicum]BAL75997.1 phosphoenolpyruvate carboxykinase [Bradyrhizobium cosmicum]